MSQNSDERFETRLLKVIAAMPQFDRSLDAVSLKMEELTGKKWPRKKLFFILKNDGFANKWQIEALLKFALSAGWMPESLKDWKHIIWTLTGKKQAVEGGSNVEIYKQLAEISDKNEYVFEENYKNLMENSYVQQSDE